MNFDAYQQVARTTAKYPDAGENLYYPALGLAGEAGEVFEKVAESVRTAEYLSEESHALLSKEFGDVLWYSAALASELGMLLSEVTLEESVEVFQASRVVPQDGDLGPLLACLDLAAACGAVAERAKKVMRDRSGVLDDVSRGHLASALLLVLERLAVLGLLLEVELSVAAEQNAEKLADRARRSVLSGEGDER